jgi:hypothetical protein
MRAKTGESVMKKYIFWLWIVFCFCAFAIIGQVIENRKTSQAKAEVPNPQPVRAEP